MQEASELIEEVGLQLQGEYISLASQQDLTNIEDGIQALRPFLAGSQPVEAKSFSNILNNLKTASQPFFDLIAEQENVKKQAKIQQEQKDLKNVIKVMNISLCL